MTSRCEGSALLLVVAATAAVSMLALATLSAALLAYEVAVLEHEGTQARLLTGSGLELVGAELAAGRLRVPAQGDVSTWEPILPPAPPGAIPLPRGCGVQVRLAVVSGPAGPRLWEGSEIAARLVDARAEASCGRGFDTREARFAVAVTGAVTRLY